MIRLIWQQVESSQNWKVKTVVYYFNKALENVIESIEAQFGNGVCRGRLQAFFQGEGATQWIILNNLVQFQRFQWF